LAKGGREGFDGSIALIRKEKKIEMKRTIFLVAIGIMISSLLAFGQQVYRWTDEKGTIHLTDDPTLVPEKFRDQIKEKEPPKEPAPPAVPKPSKEVPPKGASSKETPAKQEPQQTPVKPQSKQAPVKQEPTPAPDQKDLMGRGEDWWRARVREWNEKLLSAQKNYESVNADWKGREKELEQSKFKPDSLKRKLRAEVQTLEGKAKDLERQIAEAKNMLEKVLPKEAEQYRADPNWLK
jgi:hypothetical protein